MNLMILDGNSIVMRVWERGIGETAACGTGACAVAVAAVENGLCKQAVFFFISGYIRRFRRLRFLRDNALSARVQAACFRAG